MSLSAALELFLTEYPKAVLEPFAEHAVADFVRTEVPAAIATILDGNERYFVRGSPGQGAWAKSPWAAIFDRFVTESAQDGYYIVYLVKEDFSGAYISLNQGITSVRARYGVDAKKALEVRAADFLARLGTRAAGLSSGPIDLVCSAESGLASFYESGSVCSISYELGKIPSDKQLSDDLLRFVDLYFTLVSSEPKLFVQADGEEDEEELAVEDLKTLREHKRIERNKKLANQVKRALGYVCSACGFDFERTYGSIGKGFIEAHHLTPLHLLKGSKVALNPKKDFAVLCSNCHRMLHRTKLVDRVQEFRANYLVKRLNDQ